MRLAWSVSFLVLAACGDDSGLPDARQPDAPPPGGTVSLTWAIGHEGAALTCAQVGATVVSVTMLPEEGVFGITDAFPCGDGAGTTRSVPPGRYDVDVSLGGVAIDAFRVDDVDVPAGGDAPIGAVAFEVEPVGGFTLRVSAGGQGNCTTADMGGAGITAMAFVLEDATGTCVEATFDIAAGATQPASTYTTSCTTPAPHACIAQDQPITVAPTLPSGAYELAITGTIADAPCWTGLAQIMVPAAGASRDLGTRNLFLNDQLPGCAN